MNDKMNETQNELNFQIKLFLDSHSESHISNGLCIFTSINDILYLIYSTMTKSIIAYDLNNNQKICEIKNAHEDYITSFRHILDKNKKRDLIISVSFARNY